MAARVIPPLTGASPTITPAMLTSASLPETPPAAYNAGTTYALNATASIATTHNGFDVYRSTAPSNIGHAPASSPAWWVKIGTTFGVWVAGTYAKDDRVIDVINHLEYLSLIPSNSSTLDVEASWQVQGPTNLWRAFDVLRSSGATGPSPQTYVITPGQRVDAVGLAGIIADSFTISVKVASVEVWTYTESLSSRVTLSWSDYFLGDFTYRRVSAIFDIPKYSGAEITITFTRASGDVTVGSLWVGNATYIGEVETAPNLGRRNFSTIGEEDDGTTVLIQRRTKPEQSWVLWIDKAYLPKIYRLIELLNAVPALWSGLEDATDEYFEGLLVVGVYTRFDITPDHPDARIDLELLEA